MGLLAKKESHRYFSWFAISIFLLAGCPGRTDESDGSGDKDGDGVADYEDCAPEDTARWKQINLFADIDGDGIGSGESEIKCIGIVIPKGYSQLGTDCAPSDPESWREHNFTHRDADGDSWFVPETGVVCAADNYPSSYCRNNCPTVFDCDDQNPSVWNLVQRYQDIDGDGVGFGDEVSICIGAAEPEGTSENNSDCDPENPQLWRKLSYSYLDTDNDGHAVIQAGTICSGDSLPRGYLGEDAPISIGDCDDQDAGVFKDETFFADADGDGVGAGEPVILCIGNQQPAGWSKTNTDCANNDSAAWQSLSYTHYDRDGDGYFIEMAGELCSGASLPVGYGNDSGNGLDCNDLNDQLYKLLSGFEDADDDGVGAGELSNYCTDGRLPEGIVSQGGDCAPEDKQTWQMLEYSHRDQDADGYGIAQAGSICVGENLPSGYLTNHGSGEDCDDQDPMLHTDYRLFTDEDGDGYGISPSEAFCTNGEIPEGYSLKSNDCAPQDPTRWRTLAYRFVDMDHDGTTRPEIGRHCSGDTLPPPYYTDAIGNDCDDQNPEIFIWLALYPDADGDGVGTYPYELVGCYGNDLPEGYARFCCDENDSDPSILDDVDEEWLLSSILAQDL